MKAPDAAAKRAPQKKREKGAKHGFGHGQDPQLGKATQIKPGEVRNPGGRPKAKRLSEAYRNRLEDESADGRTVAEEVADVVIEEARSGKQWAVQEVREATEGKASTPIQVSGALSITAEENDERIRQLIAQLGLPGAAK